MNLWQSFLKVSLWLASIGLMVASSGLDGAYLSKLMPDGWAWLGLVLNTVADVTSELGMYWYGRLQMDKSSIKRKRSRWILIGQVVLVGYAWLFSWRQLVPIIAKVDAGARWMAPVGAFFIPAALIVAGYIQSLLAGRIENDTKVTQSEPKQEPVVEPIELEPATMDDFRRVLDRLGANASNLNAEQLESELAADGKRLKSESTTKRWLKVARG
jgi:hypothetical protein